MYRQTIGSLALALSFALLTACGGTKKPAESPDPTESASSESTPSSDSGKVAPSIQAAASEAPPPKAPEPSKPLPEASSSAEADIIAGKALPPSIAGGKPEKTTTTKKPKKGSKKPKKASAA